MWLKLCYEWKCIWIVCCNVVFCIDILVKLFNEKLCWCFIVSVYSSCFIEMVINRHFENLKVLLVSKIGEGMSFSKWIKQIVRYQLMNGVLVESMIHHQMCWVLLNLDGVVCFSRCLLSDLFTMITVSGLHARIQKTEENLLITDLDSTNGTFINEKKLLPGVVSPASPGNLITFGMNSPLHFTTIYCKLLLTLSENGCIFIMKWNSYIPKQSINWVVRVVKFWTWSPVN